MNNLSPGTRLGPYEVVAPAGAGGMGEVWRARDTRLDRSVAIKLLPAEFSTNVQLRVRFEREARSISQFNHPNICTLYDVGQHEGTEYLVMEFIEGETLAERIASGPLPLDQVIRYGIEIAGALQRAHMANIVHRDLKPGNVMITKTGAKLLDFGLAKDTEQQSPVRELVSYTEKRALTEEGTIVGTFQYMAPEALEGHSVDHRADVFALGAVLYEMATGRRAFAGRSKASLIASILATEPAPISEVQPLTPATLERVIRICLRKDPDERFQSAHDVKLELEWIAAGDVGAPARATSGRRRDKLAWSAAAVLAIIAVAASAMLARSFLAERSARPVRTAILPPDNLPLDFRGASAPPAISPDGKRVVFGVANGSNPRRLWVRSLESAAAQPLTGTDGASYPFWSPDGRFIAFFADAKLKKIEAQGGAAVTICDAPEARGGTWGKGGVILFTGRYSQVFRVNASGGPVAEATALQKMEVSHRWPLFLPDGRHFLYLATPTGSDDPSNTIVAGTLDDKTFRKPLVQVNSQPLYFDRHLLFVRDGILIAQRFDAKKLILSGDPVALSEQQIAGDTNFSRRFVSIAGDGTLVYQMGEIAQNSELVWFDRTGKRLGTVVDQQPFATVRLSHDDRFAAAIIRGDRAPNIWLVDLARNVKTRLTFERDSSAVWSPDGRRIVYASRRKIYLDLYLRDLATGADEPLLVTDADKTPFSWSPDGSAVFYSESSRTGSAADIHYVTVADRKSHVYLATPRTETSGMISPDGKWVAYQSNEGTRWEIYLAPFPPTGAKWQVSTQGGTSPRWRSDGGEIFFSSGAMSGRPALQAVSVKLGPTPEIGQPAALFEVSPGSGPGLPYDVSRDGQRFLANVRIGDEPPPPPLTLVQNFANELREAESKNE